MTRHFVYILCCADGSYYTGYTTDIEKRLKKHNDGTASKYTRGRRPVRVIFIEEQASRSKAQQREYAIKKLKRAEKVKLIASSPLLPAYLGAL